MSLTWGLPIVGPGEVVPGMHKSEAQCSFVRPNECDCDAHSGYAGLKRMLDGQRLHTNTCALETTGSGFDCGCQRCCHHEWCPECGYSLLIFEDGERSRRPAPKPGATTMLTGHFDCRDWRNKITVDRYRSQLAGSPRKVVASASSRLCGALVSESSVMYIQAKPGMHKSEMVCGGAFMHCECFMCCSRIWCPGCGFSLWQWSPNQAQSEFHDTFAHVNCADWRNEITRERYRSGLPGSPFIRR